MIVPHRDIIKFLLKGVITMSNYFGIMETELVEQSEY